MTSRGQVMVFVLALGALRMAAQTNESGQVSLQSGTPNGGTPIHDRGLFGQGQIIAIMDTGLDWDNCYFAEADGSPPPVNLTINDRNVDTQRRKVIAYNFLYSCVEFPSAPLCESPLDASAYDNQGHGTHAAAGAAADKGVPLAHDYGDSLARAAKLVIQDGGYVGGDNCTHRPGFGCPLRDLRPVLRQAYEQGARIHSNSWGDLQGVGSGTRPTGNYSTGARDIDAFVEVGSSEELRIALVWTDPPGTPAGVSSTVPQLVNDLDLVVVEPSGTAHYGNERLHPGARETRNNAEVFRTSSPTAGRWKVRVEATRLGLGPRQSYALVVFGDLRESVDQTRRRPVRRAR